MKWRKTSLLVTLVAMCACSPKGEAAQQGILETDSTALELPLPDVPAALKQPWERAAYVTEHFWDAMDFADTLRSHNKMFMEQNFVNFASVFPYTAEDALSRAFGTLLTRASVDKEALNTVCDLAEKYLSEADSPLRNEEQYILFLEEQLQLPTLSADERLRPTMRLQTAKKNRQGTKATDFTYTTREGKKSTLMKTPGKRLLMAFYDPACSHCTDILNGLRRSNLLNSLIEKGELNVLAVYTEGDNNLWEQTRDSLPETWTVAIDGSNIVDNVLYDIPAMPVLYLLSTDKTVLLKDPTPEMLLEYLSN